MELLSQHSSILFGGLLIVIMLSVIAMFVIATVSGSNDNHPEHTTSSQNKNINGGIRHEWKDINSY